MEELYKRVYRYSMLEDNIRVVTQTVMITNQLAEGNNLPRKKPSADTLKRPNVNLSLLALSKDHWHF